MILDWAGEIIAPLLKSPARLLFEFRTQCFDWQPGQMPSITRDALVTS